MVVRRITIYTKSWRITVWCSEFSELWNCRGMGKLHLTNYQWISKKIIISIYMNRITLSRRSETNLRDKRKQNFVMFARTHWLPKTDKEMHLFSRTWCAMRHDLCEEIRPQLHGLKNLNLYHWNWIESHF